MGNKQIKPYKSDNGKSKQSQNSQNGPEQYNDNEQKQYSQSEEDNDKPISKKSSEEEDILEKDLQQATKIKRKSLSASKSKSIRNNRFDDQQQDHEKEDLKISKQIKRSKTKDPDQNLQIINQNSTPEKSQKKKLKKKKSKPLSKKQNGTQQFGNDDILYPTMDVGNQLYSQQILFELFTTQLDQILKGINQYQDTGPFGKINSDQFEYNKFVSIRKTVQCIVKADKNIEKNNLNSNGQIVELLYKDKNYQESPSNNMRSSSKRQNDNSNQRLKTVNLNQIDDLSLNKFMEIQREIDSRESMQKLFSYRINFVKQMVSQNRKRYQDNLFDLDLTQISKRVFAMGLPGQGTNVVYRNSLSDVLEYFAKYHQGKVKFYNLCSELSSEMDKFEIPLGNYLVNKYEIEVDSVPLAHFPVEDHNPATIRLQFEFCLDALLYLAQDPANVIAIHCKAGKGRTGSIIAAYIVFMEQCSDTYEAVKIFNSRRTVDMKGLGIPSQIRYVRYFENFLSKTFDRPYKKLLAPHIKKPEIFDQIFMPKQQFKLTSICIGPFLVNPDFDKGTNYKIRIRNFSQKNLYTDGIQDEKNIDKKNSTDRYQKHYSQKSVYDALTGKYYFLITFKTLILFKEDICIEVKSIQSPQLIGPIHFRYWLNAKFIKQNVGKIRKVNITNNIKQNKPFGISELVNYDETTFEQLESEGHLSKEMIHKITKNRIICAQEGVKYSPHHPKFLGHSQTANELTYKALQDFQYIDPDNFMYSKLTLEQQMKSQKLEDNLNQIKYIAERVLNSIKSYSFNYINFLKIHGYYDLHVEKMQAITQANLLKINRNISLIEEQGDEIDQTILESAIKIKPSPVQSLSSAMKKQFFLFPEPEQDQVTESELQQYGEEEPYGNESLYEHEIYNDEDILIENELENDEENYRSGSDEIMDLSEEGSIKSELKSPLFTQKSQNSQYPHSHQDTRISKFNANRRESNISRENSNKRKNILNIQNIQTYGFKNKIKIEKILQENQKKLSSLQKKFGNNYKYTNADQKLSNNKFINKIHSPAIVSPYIQSKYEFFQLSVKNESIQESEKRNFQDMPEIPEEEIQKYNQFEQFEQEQKQQINNTEQDQNISQYNEMLQSQQYQSQQTIMGYGDSNPYQQTQQTIFGIESVSGQTIFYNNNNRQSADFGRGEIKPDKILNSQDERRRKQIQEFAELGLTESFIDSIPNMSTTNPKSTKIQFLPKQETSQKNKFLSETIPPKQESTNIFQRTSFAKQDSISDIDNKQVEQNLFIIDQSIKDLEQRLSIGELHQSFSQQTIIIQRQHSTQSLSQNTVMNKQQSTNSLSQNTVMNKQQSTNSLSQNTVMNSQNTVMNKQKSFNDELVYEGGDINDSYGETEDKQHMEFKSGLAFLDEQYKMEKELEKQLIIQHIEKDVQDSAQRLYDEQQKLAKHYQKVETPQSQKRKSPAVKEPKFKRNFIDTPKKEEEKKLVIPNTSLGFDYKQNLMSKQRQLEPLPSQEKILFKVSLNALELDKFKQFDKHPNLHILTIFYQDEECDDIIFNLQQE